MSLPVGMFLNDLYRYQQTARQAISPGGYLLPLPGLRWVSVLGRTVHKLARIHEYWLEFVHS